MSFAASTAPGAKQQFVSSKRYGRLKKMITPKTRQWGNEIEHDSMKKLTPLNSKAISSSNKQDLPSSQHILSSQTSAGEDTNVMKPTNLSQTENDKKGIRRHRHKHDEKDVSPSKDDTGGKIVGNTVYITSVKKYKEMLFQRKHYEQRIEQLETDLKEVLAFYENLYKENEILKQKLNVDDQIVAEPYKTVLNDRDVLRTAEASYKKRISQLEKELKIKVKENNAFKLEIKQLKLENKKLYEDIKRLVGQLSESNPDKGTETIQNEIYWENKPNKSEVHWLMNKKLKSREPPINPKRNGPSEKNNGGNIS